MKTYMIGFGTSKNAGDAREWGVCAYYGIERTSHDSLAYDKGSDVEAGEKHISVKASKFSLMSGRLCEGRETFDEIWDLYAERTHSNTWAYVCKDGTTYEMNKEEFKRFVYAFCKTERESSKNGGAMKIRCKEETRKMVEWFEANMG